MSGNFERSSGESFDKPVFEVDESNEVSKEILFDEFNECSVDDSIENLNEKNPEINERLNEFDNCGLTYEETTEENQEKTEVNAEESSVNLTLTELKEQQKENQEKLEKQMQQKVELEKNADQLMEKLESPTARDETYYADLSKYNKVQAEKNQILNAISELETQNYQLKDEIRNEEYKIVERGTESKECAKQLIEQRDQLQSDFNKSFYEQHIDVGKLELIQKESTALMVQMNSRRQEINMAMEVKISQMQEYVFANRFKTPWQANQNPYYASLAAEYNELKDTRSQLEYSMVKLDDNNLQISELTGNKYIHFERAKDEHAYSNEDTKDRFSDHVLETPKESVEINEEFEKVLEPFEQSNWDELDLEERKNVLEALSLKVAEDLQIKEMPEIKYYYEVCNDFGGYSYSENVVYINEYPINDGPEAADTIAHEFRHCWQHERAEKCETEFDRELKANFDDYVDRDVDYEEYLNQIVERDASGYAEKIRKAIPNHNIENREG